jgi:hypothetical protein
LVPDFGVIELMRLISRFAIVGVILGWTTHAQDLAPRAYIITPIHSNAITLAHGYSSGEV